MPREPAFVFVFAFAALLRTGFFIATGDAALAAAGLTPTQAVRMLWSLAVRYQSEPEKLRAALDPDTAEPTPDELAERQRKVEAVRRGSNLMM